MKRIGFLNNKNRIANFSCGIKIYYDNGLQCGYIALCNSKKVKDVFEGEIIKYNNV